MKHIGRAIPEKSRRLLSEGKIVSRLRYLVAIWGGTSEKNLEKAQALLNNTARFVSRMDKRTGTLELMRHCSWMTIKEMSHHSSLMMLWKIFRLGVPYHMTERIQLDGNKIAVTDHPRLLHTTNSWRMRATATWNALPADLRCLESLPKFKKQTKDWILTQREPG